jgi:L-proline amide hydrolase
MIRTATLTGFAPFHDWKTWYRITGDLSSPMTPLVVVHGGPGFTHDYVLSLANIAATGRPVIHYDQLGCGHSTHLRDVPSDFWTVALFLEELDNLLDHLDIRDDYHLLGQSWGGMLGSEHAILQPPGLRSLILCNSPASEPLLLKEARDLANLLPAADRDAINRHEAEGTTQDPEYLAAIQVFYDRHICRVLPYPPEVQASFDNVAQDPTVYSAMIGDNELLCTGSLREWSVIDEVYRIIVPTLVISGRYDEVTPDTARPFAEGIPGARWETFENSSHMPFVEEPEPFFALVNEFLAQHEPG